MSYFDIKQVEKKIIELGCLLVEHEKKLTEAYERIEKLETKTNTKRKLKKGESYKDYPDITKDQAIKLLSEGNNRKETASILGMTVIALNQLLKT